MQLSDFLIAKKKIALFLGIYCFFFLLADLVAPYNYIVLEDISRLSVYCCGLLCTLIGYFLYVWGGRLLNRIWECKLFILQSCIFYLLFESLFLLPLTYWWDLPGRGILLPLTSTSLALVMVLSYLMEMQRVEQRLAQALEQQPAAAAAGGEGAAAVCDDDKEEQPPSQDGAAASEADIAEAAPQEEVNKVDSEQQIETETAAAEPEQKMEPAVQEEAAALEAELETADAGKMTAPMSAADSIKLFARRSGLTAKEEEVLELALTSDITTKHISERLYISERVCQRYLTSIYEKTGSESRIGLIIKYYSSLYYAAADGGRT